VHMIQSIERAFEILRVLANAPARISELAAIVELPKSTVARMLYSLERVGAVTRVPGAAEYRIGDGLAALVPQTDVTANLVMSVRPHLHQLAEVLGEAAGFSVPEGYAMHYIIQVDSPRPIQVRDYSGSFAPMHLSPAGLCVMASWPEPELARYLSRPLERNTHHSVTDPATIRQRLGGIRDDGFAWIHEEFADGLSSVSAPVYDLGRVIVGAITVHGPTYRFPGRGEAASIAATVRAAASRFSVRRHHVA
jgi:IclR family transcriptional regulator, acetate operon repressor